MSPLVNLAGVWVLLLPWVKFFHDVWFSAVLMMLYDLSVAHRDSVTQNYGIHTSFFLQNENNL